MAKTNKYFSKMLVGFEVECFINESKGYSLEGIRKKIKNLHKNIEITYDGSLEFDYKEYNSGEPRENDYGDYVYKYEAEGIEIVTPPLSPTKSIKLLNRILKIVKKHGFTNFSSGLHCNFSCLNKKKLSNFYPAFFASNPLWRKIGEKFNRLDNEYCVNHADDYNIKNVLDLSYEGEDLVSDCEDKYSAVNLGYFLHNNNSRIEIRIMGGENYHKKFNLIKNYTGQILKAFDKSCIKLPFSVK